MRDMLNLIEGVGTEAQKNVELKRLEAERLRLTHRLTNSGLQSDKQTIITKLEAIEAQIEKLSGGSTPLEEGSMPPNVEAFMNEYYEATADHPFSRNARVFNNIATLEVSPFGPGVHISDVLALEKRQGAGKAAMQFLCGLADKHGVTLDLTAKAYMDKHSSPETMDTKNLKKWYVSFGFVSQGGYEEDGFDMERKPKKALKLGGADKTIKLRGFRKDH
jgi:hypothetical protein